MPFMTGPVMAPDPDAQVFISVWVYPSPAGPAGFTSAPGQGMT